MFGVYQAREAKVSKVDIMLNGDVVEPLAFVCHKDDAIIPVEIFLQLIAPTDEHARFVAIVRDIADLV